MNLVSVTLLLSILCLGAALSASCHQPRSPTPGSGVRVVMSDTHEPTPAGHGAGVIEIVLLTRCLPPDHTDTQMQRLSDWLRSNVRPGISESSIRSLMRTRAAFEGETILGGSGTRELRFRTTDGILIQFYLEHRDALLDGASVWVIG